jgi:hypothetical protein
MHSSIHQAEDLLFHRSPPRRSAHVSAPETSVSWEPKLKGGQNAPGLEAEEMSPPKGSSMRIVRPIRIRNFSILSRFWSLDERWSCEQILVPERGWRQFCLPKPVFGI